MILIRICYFFSRKFINDDVPFPVIRKDDVDIHDSSFVFMEQMKLVGFNSSAIERAITDYLRSGSSLIKLLASIPAEPIDDFDDALLDLLLDVKDEHVELIGNDLILRGDKDISRKMYRECLKINGVKIDGVNDIQPYFYKGRIHSTVESKQFSIFIYED